MKRTVVAIDGPAGSGKSTIARMVADALGCTLLDTGAFFRALALKAVREGIDLEDEKKVAALFDLTVIDIENARVMLDGEDVSDEIRRPGIASQVAPIAASGLVREKMVTRWRSFADGKDLVAEGRDQGSAVFPDARHKFFLTASVEERVRRRFEELAKRGTPVDREKLKDEIIARDERDGSRKVAPLVKAEEAVEIDTTGLSIDEVAGIVLGHVRKGGAGG